jgi:UDP-N-acetylmuramoylalanine-D-glutamate ligase
VIPVTTFAGKKVALFGLGGSGLASASALLAGGADVVAFDDNAASVAKANAAGIPTADLHGIDWLRISALVLAPGVPLTHPAPHWTVQLAQNAGVEVIGDIELFCRQRLATTPLRFANPSPPSGWIEDFHLRAVDHARHTEKTAGAKSPAVRSMRVFSRSGG